MMQYRILRIVVSAVTITGACSSAAAEVIEFEDRDEWEAVVGAFTTIDFTGFPEWTIITDQYADLGILFTDGNDRIRHFPDFVDGAGLGGGSFDDIEVSFDIPQYWIAIDFVGLAQFELFRDGELIYTSYVFDDNPSTFAGLFSTEPFDAAIIEDPSDATVAVDNLHFGPPIPAPGALSLLALGFIESTRRRRT
jgi:MYXO-CTERM domain-containing protein